MLLKFTGLSAKGEPMGLIMDTSRKLYSDERWVLFYKNKKYPSCVVSAANIISVKQSCQNDSYIKVKTEEEFFGEKKWHESDMP